LKRIKTKIGDLLVPGNKGPWPQVQRQLNGLLAGWSAYFSYGTLAPAYRAVDHHVYTRVRRFLAKRHKVGGSGTRSFSMKAIFGELGVHRLTRIEPRAAPVSMP
jgi:RNA-directed DNA polymerase